MGRGPGVAAKRGASWSESQDGKRGPDRSWNWKTGALRVAVSEVAREGGGWGLVLGRTVWQPIKTMVGQERPERTCKLISVPRMQGWADIP